MKGEGKRLNEGKIRFDLASPYAQREYAKVLTNGEQKYGANNWRLGMKWSKVLASLKRHIAAFERGEDFDSESGLYHLAHAMCNCSFLLEYYFSYPEGDDRWIKPKLKVGLDLDGVLFDFSSAYLNKFFPNRLNTLPVHWNDPRFRNEENWKIIEQDKEFWIGLDLITRPYQLLFEPDAYVTARSIPIEWTQEALDLRMFPKAPLRSVGRGCSKVEVIKSLKLDVFVDDSYNNFIELNQAGICCYLFTRPHNAKYQVGHKRVDSLQQLSKRLL